MAVPSWRSHCRPGDRPAPAAIHRTRARRAPLRSTGTENRCDTLAPGAAARSVQQADRGKSSDRRRRRGRPPRGPSPCRPVAEPRRAPPRRWRGRWEASLVRSLSEAAGRPSRYPTPSPAVPRRPAERFAPWLSLLVLALLVKILLVSLTLIEFGASPDPLTVLGQAWDQWDARHYLYLATHGYGATGEARNLIAFFPLYPALIGALAAIGLPARAAALLISNIAGVVAAILLYEIARHDGHERAAFRAAAFFTVFPTAYFLLVGYTEAVFCALTFGSVLAARHRRWLWAGLLGGLASAARLTGLALLPFIVIELVAARRALRSLWQLAVPPLLVGLGFVTYILTNLLVLGDPLAFVTVQREHWLHSIAAPWLGLGSAVRP